MLTYPVSFDGGTWKLSVDHQAGDVDAIRSTSLLGDSPVIFTSYTGDGVVSVIVCVGIPQTPRLATR